MKLKLLKLIRFFHLINKEKYNEKRQIEIVKKSPLFNKKWYLSQNPDVKAKKMGAAKHYVKHGWKEGRKPSLEFDGNEYLNEFPELREKNWCPLFHYMLEHKELMIKVSYREKLDKIKLKLADKCAKKGIKLKFLNKYEGKSKDYILIAKSKYFNKRWYLKQYPDVKKAKIDPIEHYMKYGWKEGKNPSKKFDNDEYRDLNHDVKNANINPLLHYEKYGIKEKRAICNSIDIDLENIYFNKINNICRRFDKNKKKIIIFTHELTNTGAPYAILKISKILKKNNFELIVVSPKDGILYKTFKKEAIPCIIIPHIQKLNTSFLLTSFKDFDFAICNTIILCELASKMQNIIPTLLYIHEAEEGIKDIISGNMFNNRINVLKNINSVACVSPYASFFYKPYISNIDIIHNYVEPIKIKKTKQDKKIKFAYVGAITDIRKNVSLLIRCFEKLQTVYPNIELNLIGNHKTKLYKEIKNRKIKNIIIHGELIGKSKEKLFNQIDTFVIPSSQESCSLVALEASSLSKAVIITENVGAKYMFKHNESALICKANDEKSLYENMKKIIEDKDLRFMLSRNSYKSYLKYATEDTTKKDLFNSIKNTLNKYNKKNINKLTIIVPVYNAAEKVDECIKSIIKNTKLSHNTKLLIIDDCSPSPDVKYILNKYSKHKFIDIVINRKNLGYTRNINKAINLSGKNDVVLLNSDTIVTKKWINKIQNIAYKSPSIGTVTPVSNSAGAFSVPNKGTNTLPSFLTIDKMGKVVETIGKDLFFDVPTGNGFCFFIKRDVINKVGLFDEEHFSKGYGEENDFSMRVKQNGFINIVTLDTYIFHHEHASFKESCKQLMKKGSEIIDKLYPTYKNEIEVFNTNKTFLSTKIKILEKIEDYKNEIL